MWYLGRGPQLLIPTHIFAALPSRCAWEPLGTTFLRSCVSGTMGTGGGGPGLPWRLTRETLTLPACPARPKCRAAAGPAEAPPEPAGAAAGFPTGEHCPGRGSDLAAEPHLPQHQGLTGGQPPKSSSSQLGRPLSQTRCYCTGVASVTRNVCLTKPTPGSASHLVPITPLTTHVSRFPWSLGGNAWWGEKA